ncbi:fibronectin type III domain-containing protein 5b isoform X2 [Sparus aurata]|uniref:fibronectin type III domain-containing protein 5b isoform X2 n=1 Tax=Sparus aurata TaxID=8175 RepID=UPI0011C0EF53|nr:fibronectin type III domain-containing protein 5-like isoform X2 [Sparus aurata]
MGRAGCEASPEEAGGWLNQACLRRRCCRSCWASCRCPPFVPKKDVRMLRFIQEVNTTTRSCALWDLDEDTEYIVHVQSISMGGSSPPSEPVLFRTPKESEKLASKSPDEVTMEEVGQAAQLRAGELIIIVVVLIMWAGVIALFCRQYDIIKDNEPNNNKDKAKNSSECSTPEHPQGGLLRSNV